MVSATRDGQAAEIARAMPEVTLLRGDTGALAPALWRDGLLATRSPLVAFSTTSMIPSTGWLDAMIERLEATGAAGVGGPIEPAETLGTIDRAVYLLRYLNYHRPLAGERDPEPPGDNALYRRDRLHGLESILAHGFWESEIHRVLRFRGERLTMAGAGVVAYQGGTRFGPTLAQRFRHARRYGSTRGAELGASARWLRAAASPIVPAVMLRRIAKTLQELGHSWAPWIPALPGLAILLTAWAAGESLGILAPRSSSERALATSHGRTLWLGPYETATGRRHFTLQNGREQGRAGL